MSYGGTNEAWIVGAVRTPIGRHGGALSAVRPDDLGAVVLEALVERTGVPPSEVEDVYFGCANQAGEDNRNVARMSLLLAGFPETVAGVTVNRLCGSGLEAVAQAARAVMLGEADVYVGGGVESMSRAPWAVPKPERAFPTGNATMYDTTLGWRMVNPKMEEMGHTDSLGMTAENLAQERFLLTPDEDELRRGGLRLRRLQGGPGPLRPQEPREGRRRDGRKALSRRDRPRDGEDPKRRDDRRGRRGTEARHLGGEAGQAQAGLQGRWVRHARQLQLPQRRGRGGAGGIARSTPRRTASNPWQRYGASPSPASLRG